MRETGIFTGTTSSLRHSLRQSSDRYAIRAGRNLPDKEFRSIMLLSAFAEGSVISANLCMSPCSPDYIFIGLISESDAWRVVSEDSKNLDGFLRFIVCTMFAISAIPSTFKCLPCSIKPSTSTNFSKSCCFAVRKGFSRKKGTIFCLKSATDRTQKRYKCSLWLSLRRFIKMFRTRRIVEEVAKLAGFSLLELLLTQEIPANLWSSKESFEWSLKSNPLRQ